MNPGPWSRVVGESVIVVPWPGHVFAKIRATLASSGGVRVGAVGGSSTSATNWVSA